jgi:hypothetical protein
MPLDRTTVFHSHDRAAKMAEELSKDADGWTFTVVKCSEKWSRIDVYDEDGILVHKGM